MFILDIYIIDFNGVILVGILSNYIGISWKKLGFGLIDIYCKFLFVTPLKNSVEVTLWVGKAVVFF